MQVKIKTTILPKRITEFLKIIKDNRLYSGSGSGFDYVLKGHNKPSSVSIAYIDNLPVGCSIFTEDLMHGCYNCGVYIKPAYRRYGIGTKVIKALHKRKPIALKYQYCGFFNNLIQKSKIKSGYE